MAFWGGSGSGQLKHNDTDPDADKDLQHQKNQKPKQIFCVEEKDPDPELNHENIHAVLRIHGILVWIRVRILIRGSMPLNNEFRPGSGSCYVPH